MGKKQKKEKVIQPPELPPDVPDEEIEVSDEDVKFVQKNHAYTGFVSRLDTQSITEHVTRVTNAKEAKAREDDLEASYERLLKKKIVEDKEEKGLEVDRVDALPIKTLDGKLCYRTVPKESGKLENEDKEDDDRDNEVNEAVVKLTKPERRAKLKKKRKEKKKLGKEPSDAT